MGADIGVEVYRRTLYQPYSFHVACNTSEIIAGLNKVETVAFDVINSLVQSATSLVLSMAILGALIRIDPVTAIMAGLGFTVLYLVVILSARRRLRANSKIIAENATNACRPSRRGWAAFGTCSSTARKLFTSGASGGSTPLAAGSRRQQFHQWGAAVPD